MMEPSFLAFQDQKIFTVLHPAASLEEGFVFCYPAPQDMLRAHPSQVSLAKKLQSLGFPVLRFDYSGTGDSSGSIQTISRWKDETLAVVQDFKRRTGVEKISLLGTRLGGSIAILASQEQGFKRLLLWDPIADGSDLLKSYRAAHHRLLHRVPDEAPYPQNQKYSDQSCGYPWPKSMQQEIGRINPSQLHTYCKRIQIVASESNNPLNSLIDRWRSEDRVVVSKQPGEDLKWGHDLYMTHRLFAPSSLRILSLFAGEG